MILSLLFLFVITLYFLIPSRISKINKNIPGPTGYPMVGNLFQINKNVVKSIDSFYKEFGSVYRLRMGNIETVVLTGIDTLEESFLLNKHSFVDRFVKKSRKINNGLDIIHSNGEYWKILKTIFQTQMTPRKIKSYQFEIQSQVDLMTERLYKSKNDNNIVTNINENMKLMLFNIMSILIFGKQSIYSNNNDDNNNDDDNNVDDNDNEKKHIIFSIGRFFKTSGSLFYSDFIPILLPFDLINLSRNNFFNDFQVLTNFVSKNVTQQLLKLNNNNNNNNKEENEEKDKDERKSIVEAYLENYLNGEIKYESVLSSCTNLLLAGTDSSANTLSFLLVSLINNPEIQEKVYNEIITNLTNDEISINDRFKCPYTCAVIKETHRLYSIAPLSEPHYCSNDVEIKGFKISKGTQIIQNIYSSSRSEQYWDKPLSFIPERFFDNGDADGENNNINKEKNKNIVSFGLGLRGCIGKSFAEYMIFLTVVRLIKNFKFSNPFPNQPLKEIGEYGLVMNCANFNAKIEKRKLK
ncbi:hypothetical protein ACTFIZ_007027 [Dictyostelium cf. discoideum]